MTNEETQARQARIDAASKRCLLAHQELAAAGKELLEAVGATEDEIEDAAECLADCLNDESSIEGHVGASHWDAMLADQVLNTREWNEEERLEQERIGELKAAAEAQPQGQS